MAKTQEELNRLKNEYEALHSKLKELTEEELLMVTGGFNEDDYHAIESELNMSKEGAQSIIEHELMKPIISLIESALENLYSGNIIGCRDYINQAVILTGNTISATWSRILQHDIDVNVMMHLELAQKLINNI